MKTINFSTNWNNKLDCNVFTTIRLATGKYKLNEIYAVMLKGKHISNVTVLDVQVIKLEQLRLYIAYLDTGYNLEETKCIIKKMYPDKDFLNQLISIMLLKKVSTPRAAALPAVKNETLVFD